MSKQVAHGGLFFRKLLGYVQASLYLRFSTKMTVPP